MYDKWNLERYPFYLRPIDKSSLNDFYGRDSLINELSLVSRSREGVAAVIGERGVGTTSLSNYCRFNQPAAYTFKYEIRIEEFNGAAEVFEAIVYSMAQDLIDRKIPSKTAKKVLDNYNIDRKGVDVSARIAGIGVKITGKTATKNIFPVLHQLFVSLIDEILHHKKFRYCIFQLNNFDASSMDESRIIELLNIFRDIFHTPKTIWYLLGDIAFEDLIQKKVNRVSTVIRHWVHVVPTTPDDFMGIFNRRIENSGKDAVNPFTEDAIHYLAECTVGRPRFALDIAGRILDRLADNPYVTVITKELVERFANDEINNIAQLDQISPISLKLLLIIKKNPGKNSTELSEISKIPPGNLMKYIHPLIKRSFVRSIRTGRQTVHYPHGLTVLIGEKPAG